MAQRRKHPFVDLTQLCALNPCYLLGRLTHDLILPLWKSDVSVSLMIDKKAKRHAVCIDICSLSLIARWILVH